MPELDAASELRGHVLRFAWDDGPTRGSVHEHVFHADGTVGFHAVGAPAKDADRGGHPERPRYADLRAGADVRLVSYLSGSGYTLTVALNFADRSIVGVASNERTWTPVRGRFQVVG